MIQHIDSLITCGIVTYNLADSSVCLHRLIFDLSYNKFVYFAKDCHTIITGMRHFASKENDWSLYTHEKKSLCKSFAIRIL